MAGLLTHGSGDGGVVHCTICGADAAGPCARCRKPVCGDCCVLTEATAGRWAICLNCDRIQGRNLRRPWVALAAWLLVPIALLIAVLVALHYLFG